MLSEMNVDMCVSFEMMCPGLILCLPPSQNDTCRVSLVGTKWPRGISGSQLHGKFYSYQCKANCDGPQKYISLLESEVHCVKILF